MRRIAKLLLVSLMLLVPFGMAAPSQAADSKLPAGTCHAQDGCGCGGIYVLKYKFILAHC